MFNTALDEDRLLATKMMFYARNVRGGLGERKVFRVMLKFMGDNYPEVMAKNMDLVGVFGRYDDLYALVGTKVEDQMWKYVGETLWSDFKACRENGSVTLLAKWLKSVNTSSKESNRLGRLTAQKLGVSLADYRKMLSYLRGYIRVTEVAMSKNNWSEINYEAVPSVAMKNYRSAFGKHDGDRFTAYIESVTKGEKKINASTLYPYDILIAGGFGNLGMFGNRSFTIKNDAVLEAQWKALPNYIEGENNILVMGDTSGSMTSDGSKPLATSIGLSIYFAERNKGIFKDMFMTFSAKPSIVQLKGSTLREKVESIPSIVANTNLELAFDLILTTAVKNNVPVEQMPKSLVIISDMQFDEATSQYSYRSQTNTMTFYESMVEKFENYGYPMPNVVFWNVGSYSNTYTTDKNRKGVQIFSGFSQAIFKSVLASLGKTPYEAMVATLNDPMYDVVQ
jgi:type III secretion system FlhB-like substrate exporter